MPDLDDIFDIVPKKYRKKYKKRFKKKLRKQSVWQLMLAFFAMLLQSFLQLFSGEGAAQRPSAATPPTRKAAPKPSAGVQDRTLADHLAQAGAYTGGLVELAANSTSEWQQARLQELSEHAQAWQVKLESLALRVDAFKQNRLIQRDLKQVPEAIQDLETRLQQEENPLIRGELERTLTNRRQQRTALEKLRQTMEWAEVKVESTVSMLGTIYSQALIGQSQGQVADYRRLLDEVDEEVLSLEDYLAALEEVKFGRDARPT